MAKSLLKGKILGEETAMLIRAVTTIALYCPRCGKLNLHDISHFAVGHEPNDLVCSCGYKQAAVMRAGAFQFELTIPCVMCQSTHHLFFDRRALRHIEVEKIYCPSENFELGFIGRHDAIEATRHLHKSEFCRLWQDGSSEEDIRSQQIVLEVLNKVHDIASEQHIYCMCGAHQMTADLLPEGVLLTCLSCGSYELIPATEAVLARLYETDSIVMTGIEAMSHEK